MAMNLGVQLGVHEEVGIEHGSAAGIVPPAVAPSATKHGITGVFIPPLTAAMTGALSAESSRRAHDPTQRRRPRTVPPTKKRAGSRSPRPTTQALDGADVPLPPSSPERDWHEGKPGPGCSLEDLR